MSRLPMPVRIATERVLLRNARDADRAGFIELQTDPEVWAYLGGPSRPDVMERRLDAIGLPTVTAAPGAYVVADKATDELIGTLEVKRPTGDLPFQVADDGEELELGYLLRRDAWGAGLAFEAATAALRAAAQQLPDQPVIVVTQTANERSLRLAARLGFRTAGTFEQFGAEQTFGVARLHSFRTGKAT